MSTFGTGNICLLLAVLCGAGSQIVLKALVNETGPLQLELSSLQTLCQYGKVLRLAAALLLLVSGFVFWLLSMSRLNLSYAYPLSCSSALFVAFFSAVFLGEGISLKTWLGTLLIVVGTILILPPHEHGPSQLLNLPTPGNTQPATGQGSGTLEQQGANL